MSRDPIIKLGGGFREFRIFVKKRKIYIRKQSRKYFVDSDKKFKTSK